MLRSDRVDWPPVRMRTSTSGTCTELSVPAADIDQVGMHRIPAFDTSRYLP
jgi:hypothetical protein